jgi:ABC-2 type transport system permease protein
MNTMKWLLKREYWEHKGGFFWAPVVVSGLLALLTIGSMLFASVAGSKGGFRLDGNNSAINLQQALNDISDPQKIEFAQGLAAGYPAVAMPLMFTLGFVVFFYCLGSLYDERKDRSILFWKSLPVSDRDTVISKSLTALFVGPLIAVAFALVLSLLVLFSLMVLAAFHGLNLFGLVLGDKNFYLVFLQILSFIPVYVLWALPTVGYLLFVSSWAKTKPFLWAVGVPVLGGVILTWVNALAGSPFVLQGYWKVIVARGLGSVFPGSWLGQVSESNANINPDNAVSMLIANTYSLLGTANLWIGVAIGLAFLVGAVKMRRYRDEG